VDSWATREDGLQRLREAGYWPQLVSGQQYKVLVGRRTVNFWPSGWKWQGAGRNRGCGLETLIAYLGRVR
jgi:hypothetical protein